MELRISDVSGETVYGTFASGNIELNMEENLFGSPRRELEVSSLLVEQHQIGSMGAIASPGCRFRLEIMHGNVIHHTFTGMLQSVHMAMPDMMEQDWYVYDLKWILGDFYGESPLRSDRLRGQSMHNLWLDDACFTPRPKKRRKKDWQEVGF